MSEDFHHKHIHSVIWLIAIMLVVIIIAAFLVVKLTNNAPVGEIIPDVSVTPVMTTDLPGNDQPDTVVTNSHSAGQDGIEAGRASLSSAEMVRLGDDISVTVTMDTDNRNINVAKVTLMYDPAKLRYEGFDKTNSVLSMEFRDEPTPGMIVMSRGAPGAGGYIGRDGTFGSFQFTALEAGQTEISLGFHNTIYYLDDGLGSKIYPEIDKLNIIIN